MGHRSGLRRRDAILLTSSDAGNGYQPFAFAEQCRSELLPGSIALVTASDNPHYPAGAAYRSDRCNRLLRIAHFLAALAGSVGRVIASTAEDATFLLVPVELPPKLLVLGAGPDAMPLVEIAGLMGWHVTVLDHRPAYAIADRFPQAQRSNCGRRRRCADFSDTQHFDAAVVMSHHLTSDEAYLAALAESSIPYIGLLGPAPRRARLMNDIGEQIEHSSATAFTAPSASTSARRTPETIALAIVARNPGSAGGPSWRLVQRDRID